MQILGVPGVMPQWFAPSPRLAILESCPEQYDPLNTLCCAPGTHSFASSDDADCLARPRLRLPATACHREVLLSIAADMVLERPTAHQRPKCTRRPHGQKTKTCLYLHLL